MADIIKNENGTYTFTDYFGDDHIITEEYGFYYLHSREYASFADIVDICDLVDDLSRKMSQMSGEWFDYYGKPSRDYSVFDMSSVTYMVIDDIETADLWEEISGEMVNLGLLGDYFSAPADKWYRERYNGTFLVWNEYHKDYEEIEHSDAFLNMLRNRK